MPRRDINSPWCKMWLHFCFLLSVKVAIVKAFTNQTGAGRIIGKFLLQDTRQIQGQTFLMFAKSRLLPLSNRMSRHSKESLVSKGNYASVMTAHTQEQYTCNCWYMGLQRQLGTKNRRRKKRSVNKKPRSVEIFLLF